MVLQKPGTDLLRYAFCGSVALGCTPEATLRMTPLSRPPVAEAGEMTAAPMRVAPALAHEEVLYD